MRKGAKGNCALTHTSRFQRVVHKETVVAGTDAVETRLNVKIIVEKLFCEIMGQKSARKVTQMLQIKF